MSSIDQWICDFDPIVSAVLPWESLLFCDLHGPVLCWTGRPDGSDGVDRTNRENIKYLTPSTFLKCDGIDSPFC